MRNLAAKVPESAWPEFKARVNAVYHAPGRAIARDLAKGVVADFERELPTAVSCFRDDFEACIAHQRMPINYHRAIRSTNLLERLFVEERRRLKVPPNALGKQMFGAMWKAAARWKRCQPPCRTHRGGRCTTSGPVPDSDPSIPRLPTRRVGHSRTRRRILPAG